jgi:hypothetical protein
LLAMKPAIRPKTIQAMIPMKDLSWLNSVECRYAVRT